MGDRRVRAHLHSKDQYDRVVATVTVRRGLALRRRDVSLEMLKAGMATVSVFSRTSGFGCRANVWWRRRYEAKTNAEFGGRRAQYEEAEARAKKMRVGLWRQPKRLRVSPHEYKMQLREAQKKPQCQVRQPVRPVVRTVL